MISALIVDGVVKLMSINSYRRNKRATCKIFSLQSQLPERVLTERILGSGVFRDKESGKRFKTNGEIVVAL